MLKVQRSPLQHSVLPFTLGYVCLVAAVPLLQVAFDNSVDKHRVTPYSRAATEAFDMVYSGGKPDDITVLVAVIS